MSAVLGYAHPRLIQVIGEQAERGVQFFLPVESAFAVCEQLRHRFGLPRWQFTLAASSANVESLRIARLATGRQGVLLFDGKYHGHLNETLWTHDGTGLVPESSGLGNVAPSDLAVVGFNDLDAVEAVLKPGRTAAVLTEGVLTNCGTVLPDPGFLPGLRDACTRYGTLLIIDETHTQFDLYGGAVSRYGVQPDMVTGGKGIGGGIPIGAYGMTSELANLVQANLEDETGVGMGVGLGGTLFANALSLRCAEVVLTELMTPAEHDRIAGLAGAWPTASRPQRGNGDLTGAPIGSVRVAASAFCPSSRARRSKRTSASTRSLPTRAGCTSRTGESGTRSRARGHMPASPTRPQMSTSTSEFSATS